MAKDELPSINDILGDSNLPSYKDFLEKKEELPSVKEYFPESNQDFIEEETQTIEDVNGESFLEVTDVIQTPEWSELVRLVNDVRKDIPKIPEIKYYDEQLDEICSKISEIEQDYAKSDKIDTLSTQNEEFEGKLSDIKEEINNLPEVKYYEEDLKVLKLRIEQVKEAIPTFPDWIQEVHEVPDFSWIGKSFSIIDDDFSKVQGHLDLMKEKIDRTVNQINEDYDIRKFEFKVDLKNIDYNFDQTNNRITETKDKIYKELKDSSIRIWELHNTFKDDDRKLKKHLTSEQNKLKQSLEKEIEKINEQSIKADESILEFFNDLKETIDALPNTLPEVKYYDKDISSLRSDISSLKKGIKELNKISSSIKKDQKKLEENYLLNEPSDTKQEVEGTTDPLTPLDQKFATLDDLSNHYKLFINRINTQLSTLGGGGAVNIRDMDDVQFDRTTGEGKLLIYDQTKSKWVGIASTALSSTGLSGSPDITVTNITATGNVSIAGTLTYEDVTNVDSLGVGTFRNGIVVNTGTATTALLVEGDARITGILSVGQGTITLDPSSDEIKIGDTKLKRNSSSGAIEIRDKHNALKSIKMSKIQSDHVIEDDQGNLSVTGILTATSFVKTGGTSSQFLKADGSVDSGTYVTSADGGNADQLDGEEGTYYLNYNNFTNKPTIPSNTNQLTNGAGFITSADGGNADQLDGEEGTYYLDYGNFTNTPTIPSNTNQLTNGAGFITTSFTNTNQLTNGAGFITSADGGNADQLDGEEGTYYLNYNNFTNKPTIPSNTNQLTNGAGFITGSSSGTELTGIVTSIIAGNNITISGSTGEVTINSSGGGGGNSGYANTAGIATVAQGLTGTPDITVDDITAGSVNVSGIVTATSFVKSGGTSSQFLKANGSVDSNTYLTSYTETDPVVAAINGIVKSNGTTISAATAGTDYLTPSGDGSGLTGLTGASANTYGSSGATPVIVVDSDGRITGISTVAISGGGGGISNVVEDTTPQLGGNLDLNSKDITGTGRINITGIVTATNIVSVKSDDGTSGRVDLYCESNNAHYARLQAPDHGDFSGNPTIKLPSSSGTLLLNNGSGANLTSLTGASAATYGDSGSTPVIVVDANGRITGISTASISGGGSYTDSAVDTHLNVSGASSGQILSWNGSDYAWVADQTGGGGGTTQNLFETIAVSGQSDIVADSATDTLTLVAGSNMTITTNSSGDSITFSSSGGGGGGGGGVTTGKAIAMAMVFG